MLEADEAAPDFTLPIRAPRRRAARRRLALADADHAVADAYGTWVEKSMYGKKY